MEIDLALAPVSDPPTSTLSPQVFLEWGRGLMTGAPVQESLKTLGNLNRIFYDGAARGRMESAQAVYRVRWWSPVEANNEGGLYWGVTEIKPGKVGDEYFMTRGHFHANRTRAEYYGTISGNGMLLLMDAERRMSSESMSPGSLHYIRGQYAHRVVNVGNEPLVFWACWPSDAGYDYESVAERGFGVRVVERNGQPVVIANE
jgi:glucose-6-phosphate isomerase